MTTHVLKCSPVYFQQHVDGVMPFTHRKNDRDYHVGDRLLLQECDLNRAWGKYTGKEQTFEIIRVWHNLPGVDPEYVVMLIKLAQP